MNRGVYRAFIGVLCLLAGLAASAQPRYGQSVLDMSYKIGNPVLPVAAYRNMGVAEFRSMVRKAFQESGFAFVAADEYKTKSTILRFDLVVSPQMGLKPSILVSVDELPDGTKRCNPCFLRFAKVGNAAQINELPWMTQYDLSALLVPAIDKAYAKIGASGRESMDPSFGFQYTPRWAGEQNLFGNSFVGMDLPSLKERIVKAYRNAGFVPVERDADPKASELALTFNFPIDPAQNSGVVYTVKIHSQYAADGRCYPCEVSEGYDPYQQLPSTGLSGILNRSTLESKFSTARNAAYDSLRVELAPSLRPRTVFRPLAKPAAPLGTPRPPPMPVVVT